VWPEPTHGDPSGIEARTGILKPWRTAAEIIDWSLPCPSIFERKRPLAENTMRRIARGIQKFVIDNPKPFVVQVNHGGDNFRGQSIIEPLPTITAKHGFGLVTPIISQIGHTGGGNRLHDIQEPLSTIVSKNEHMLVTPIIARQFGQSTGHKVTEPMGTITDGGMGKSQLVAAFLSKYHGEKSKTEVRGQKLNEPVKTLDTSNRFSLVTSHLVKMKGDNIGQAVDTPLQTITAGGLHFGEVRAFLLKYYGADVGQDCNDPLHTVTSKDRFGLVTIQGQDYQIVDIGMRMLTPRELFNAQGFPEDYIIDRDYDGNKYPGYLQVAMCGNSVPPPFSEALTRANLPELCTQENDNKLENMG
jgi:DNA (cytosine-5)-methyltransferase 1